MVDASRRHRRVLGRGGSDVSGFFLAQYTTLCPVCDGLLTSGQVARMTHDGAAHERCEPPRAPCPRCYLVHASAQGGCTDG